MSLSNFFFGDPEEDPIFSHTMNSMRQMQNHMMSNMLTDPFRMFGMPSFGGFGLAPRQMHSSPFPGMNLNRLLAGGPEHGVSYSSSSVFSVTSSGTDGRPQVYQETSSVRSGPDGLKETRRTVQDSTTGKKKMAIGHHIGERAHVVEKEQNLHTGEREEREDFINLDESDTEEFERDFEQKSLHNAPGRQRCQIEEISSEPLLAIQSSEDIQHQQQQQQRNRLATPRRSYQIRPSPSPLTLPSTSRHETSPSLHPHPYNPQQTRKNRSSKLKGQQSSSHHHHH
ncbi:CLUMA_CG003211, isoform A [Clunio marinus]|uniref:CLUMA_CG003211, isoform A n=1 Tax=Clunio marinus TaxID=568069 RepID=A0A1J1HTG0_9DIPT|nr:CLUMA_CG003211, isoform A [Clunio marinus]